MKKGKDMAYTNQFINELVNRGWIRPCVNEDSYRVTRESLMLLCGWVLTLDRDRPTDKQDPMLTIPQERPEDE